LSIISAAARGCNFTFDELFPIRVDTYPDVIQFHLWDALGPRERARWHECMRAFGGYENQHPNYYSNEPRWIRGQPRLFRERLRVEQPSPEALRMLMELRGNHGVYLTYGERALDPIFPLDDVEEASFVIRRHLMIRNHRSQLTSDRGTMYINPASSRRNIGLYHDKGSKPTREPCVHIDYRMKGHATLVANRLGWLDDWLYVDDHAFFAPRLIQVDLDYGRLGRLLQNRKRGESRRSGRVMDRSRGLWDFQEHGLVEDAVTGGYLSIQRYLDQRRRHIDIYSCLIQLDNYYLLPKRRNPNTHYTDQVPSAPFRHFQAHGMGTTTHFRPSKTTFPRTPTTSTPVLASRTSKSTPIPCHRLPTR
jgi:hypothetical protein